MLINECKPRVTSSGNLRFSIPGFERSEGEITPWRAGFDTRRVRRETSQLSQLWALRLFPSRPARPLPDDVVDFLAGIPADMRERATRFQFGQALTLKTLARSSHARDLSVSHPALLWLMVVAVYDGRFDADHLPELCRLKQLDILRRIVRGATRPALRLLHRVETGSGTLGDAHALMDALSETEIVRLAAHQRNVTVRLLRALAKHHHLVQPSLMALLTSGGADGVRDPLLNAHDLAAAVRDIGRMARTLGIERPDQALARCRSMADIDRLHDRWMDRLNGADDGMRRRVQDIYVGPPRCPRHLGWQPQGRSEDHLEFPPPPFPDGETIRAITTIDELRAEGRQQSNCVGSYGRAVAAGRSYVYRVTEPQRGTLELNRSGNGWRLGQFRLAGNRPPAESSRVRVVEWFEQCTRAADRGRA